MEPLSEGGDELDGLVLSGVWFGVEGAGESRARIGVENDARARGL